MRTLTGRTVLFFLAVLSPALPFPEAEGEERKPPKRPDRPFTIRVHAEPRGEPEIEEKILRARDEFRKSIDRRDDWFLPVDDSEQAEIVVELKALFIEDDNSAESRTSYMGGLSHTSTYLVEKDRHHLYAAVMIFGGLLEITAGDSKGEAVAAATLTRELNKYVKSNYWQILERRDLQRASGASPEDLGLEWIRAEVVRGVEAMNARIDVAEWQGESFVVQTASEEFRFPFAPQDFGECVRSLVCQEQMAKQIVDHLKEPLGNQ